MTLNVVNVINGKFSLKVSSNLSFYFLFRLITIIGWKGTTQSFLFDFFVTRFGISPKFFLYFKGYILYFS